MSKLRLLTLVGLLAAALTPLYGCGSECAEGTTDQDGECVVAAEGCAEGTALQNGVCLLDDSGCGEGTMLSEGECVPAEESCTGNTTFDQGTLTCVPNTTILCGEGTEVGDDGYCVPSEEACTGNTMLDDNGRCVLEAAVCGDGTVLDATDNECVLDAAGCGTGLSFDEEAGTCVPTEEICDVGTKFDAESGLCLPDSCSMGDVVIDGICMSPAEDLAKNPDLTETENNDPALGGTAETLVINPIDDAFTFVGAIGSPSDLDGDSALDQDIDVYEFDANAGEWFEIMVQSTGLQAPAFVVEGPNDYIRYSPMGRSGDAAREIVVPEDGTYTITVLPSLVLQSGGEVNLIGGDDWTYVGSFKPISPATATDVDMSTGAGQFSGDYVGLTDNFFELTGLTSGEIVSLRFDASGADAEAIATVFDDTGAMIHSEGAGNRATVEFTATGTSASVLLDWSMIDGPATEFEISASVIGYERTITMLPGDSETFQVTPQVDDQIVATQTNPQSAELGVTIVEDATGDELAADAALGSGESLLPRATSAGSHTVTFTNSSAGNVDATMTVKLRPPFRFGLLNPGTLVSTGPFELADDALAYATFSVGLGQIIEVSQDNEDDQYQHVTLFDDGQGTEVAQDTFMYPLSYDGYSNSEFIYAYSQAGGDYRVELEGRDDIIEQEIFVYTYTPTPVTLSTTGATFSETGPALMENQRQYYLVDIGTAGSLSVTGSSNNGEDIDLYAYDLTLSSQFSSTTSGGIDLDEAVSPGQFLVAIEPDEDIGSYTISVELMASAQ